MESIYLTPDQELLQQQVARFIAREVEPHALAWEDAGFVPREVLRKMGDAGLLGVMYSSEHGGAEADALTNLAFAEALSQSTFGGFIMGCMRDTARERLWRDARILAIGGGATEVMLDEVAKRY